MGDLLALPLLVGVPAALAALTALGFRRWRPRLGYLRVVLLAPLPLPGLALIFCAWVFTSAATTPPGRCGTDACAMAMAGAFFLALAALAAYGVGTAAAALALRWGRR